MRKGIVTAIITPFRAGKVDLSSFESLLIKQKEAQVHGVLVCGTTGEAPTLSVEERFELIKKAKEILGDIPVIAGAGGNSFTHTLKLSEAAIEAGADALLIVTPYYNKPPSHSLIKYYEALVEKINFPIMIYNVPSRTGINISVEAVVLLSQLPQIVGIKEASGMLSRIIEIENSKKRQEFTIMSGDDPLFLPSMVCGAKGVISVASNIIPEVMVEIYNKWTEGEVEEASKIFRDYYEFFNSLFIETNPLPVKAMLNLLGLIELEFRLPLTPPQPSTIEKLKEILFQYRIL